MDEKEKDLAGEIFKICRAMTRISGAYFREEIDSAEFLKLFLGQVSLLQICLKVYS